MRSFFTLAIVASQDGFVARFPGERPSEWASREEQILFLAEIEAADWSIMDDHTHEASFKPNRRRIVFASVPRPEWRERTHLWIDPDGLRPDNLVPLVAQRRPLKRGLILGGARVNDWFHKAGRVNRILLTVEPLTFGDGLPAFSSHDGPVDQVLQSLGYRVIDDSQLNKSGTRLMSFAP